VCETQRPQYPNSNIGLDLAIPMVSYCYAYSLLYDGFALSERADIERWVRDMAGKIRFGHEAWIQANYFGGQDFNNHLSAHVMALAIIGYTLRDQAMIDYAIDSPDNPRDWGEMVDGAILMPTQPQATHGPGAQWDQKEIEAGEIYDRTRISQGKGLGYSLVNLKDLTFTAEVARNNGLDLYSHTGPYGENLKVSYDYFSNYVIAKDPSALAGGYYTEETTAPGEAVALYEMVYRVWPDDPKIEAVLRSCDRVVDQHAFLGWTVVLTHGMPVE
ncbi:alginate lyase family protein, partial [bacterium]|nr:alginate lyase family protein [bacterium]